MVVAAKAVGCEWKRIRSSRCFDTRECLQSRHQLIDKIADACRTRIAKIALAPG